MQRTRVNLGKVALTFLLLVSVTGGYALADGSEQLGPVVGLTIEPGSGIVAAGVGLIPGQPGVININVPGTVKQALIYWMGARNDASGDDTIIVNLDEIRGVKIGGFTQIPGNPDGFTSTYRAVITSKVSSGPNALVVEGLDFDRVIDGAGVIVIYDDGSPAAEIDIRDGNDFAFALMAQPVFQVTVPQTFNFLPALTDRTARLVLFFADVSPNRGHIVRVSVDGAVTDIPNPAGLVDDGWDTVILSVDVPAGASSLTVEAISGDGSPLKPASLLWGAAALELSPTDGQGCTPGYWKNLRKHGDSWIPTGLDPGDDFDNTFGVDWYDPDIDLITALSAEDKPGEEGNNGGINKCARHGTAALLNALHPAVDYPRSAAEVIAAVQANDCDVLAGLNELSDECPAEDY